MALSAGGAAAQVHQHHGRRALRHDGRPRQLPQPPLHLLPPPPALLPAGEAPRAAAPAVRRPLVPAAALLLLGQRLAAPSLPGPATSEDESGAADGVSSLRYRPQAEGSRVVLKYRRFAISDTPEK